MKALRLVHLGAAFIVFGCNDQYVTTTSPPPELSLAGTEFTASISKSAIPLGDSATLRFVLRNTSTETLRMTFGGCQVLYYVKDNDNNFVFPKDGAWACTGAISSIVLAPGGEHVVTVPVRSSAPDQPIYPGIPVSLGKYSAYAELTNGRGRTNTVTFTVVP
jgi:hypothetical protein